MFESINSKGKKLEEIDLIKTYIFSKLDEASYATYLDKQRIIFMTTSTTILRLFYVSIDKTLMLIILRQFVKVDCFSILMKQKNQKH